MKLRTAFFSLIALTICTACEPFTSEQDSCENHDDAAQGDPGQYPLAAGATLGSVAVHAPLLCEKQEGYIYVERAQGKRVVGRAGQPGVPMTGCPELPAAPQDLTQCPVVAPYAIAKQAFDQLQSQGVLVNGIGEGPCIDEAAAPDNRHFSMGVVNWGDAQAAVNLVAQLFERYDLKGGVGVAVRGIGCAYPK